MSCNRLTAVNPIGLDGATQGTYWFVGGETEGPEPEEDTPRASPASSAEEEQALVSSVPAARARRRQGRREGANNGRETLRKKGLDEKDVLDAGDEPMTRSP